MVPVASGRHLATSTQMGGILLARYPGLFISVVYTVTGIHFQGFGGHVYFDYFQSKPKQFYFETFSSFSA